MNKAVFKYRFRNNAGAVGNAHQHHELGLHIRRKSGIWLGFDIYTDNFIITVNMDSFFMDADSDTCALQLIDTGPHMIRFAIHQGDVSMSEGCPNHKCTGFDSIRNDFHGHRPQ